jgi:hypothetical protein
MSWDPEIDDPIIRRLPTPDVDDDLAPPLPPATAPSLADLLAPIDPDAPISGHHAPLPPKSIADAPEHDWGAASAALFPLLRPAGTQGSKIDELDVRTLAARGNQTHAQPLVDDAPGGLSVVFAIASPGFDVIANADHVLAWGVAPSQVRDTAFENLAFWSGRIDWSEESDGERRLLSSASGEGWDASRILLADVRAHLAKQLAGGGARVLIGIPERDLLVAGRLAADDTEFAGQFEAFVRDQADAANEPIDRRVFELRDGQLVAFAG